MAKFPTTKRFKRLGWKYGIKVQFNFHKSPGDKYWSCLVSSREKIKIRIHKHTRRVFLHRWLHYDDNFQEVETTCHRYQNVRPAGKRWFEASFDCLYLIGHNNKVRFCLEDDGTHNDLIVKKQPNGEWVMDWDFYRRKFYYIFENTTGEWKALKGTPKSQIQFDRAIDIGSYCGKCLLNVMK